MKKSKWLKWAEFFTLLLAVMFVAISCENQTPNISSFHMENSKNLNASGRSSTLKLTSWNVQTFFDAENCGKEYSEFIKSKKWGTEAYVQRLKRLCSVIRQLDSDVFIMEEIENSAVLYDIYNFLAGEWDQKKVYGYGAFASESGSSIGIGVLSRYPLENLRIHSLQVEGMGSEPSMRPLVMVDVVKDGKKMTLLLNHWKSMSGGEAETEYWRVRQEGVLAYEMLRLEEEGVPFIAAGDFNRDLFTFMQAVSERSISMRQWKNGKGLDSGIEVKSPWFTGSELLEEPGSYFFKGEWNRIDHFFLGKNVNLVWFRAETEGDWCSEESSVPCGYKINSGEGYSDHLPITCKIIF